MAAVRVRVTPKVVLIFWGYTKCGDAHGVKPLAKRATAQIELEAPASTTCTRSTTKSRVRSSTLRTPLSNGKYERRRLEDDTPTHAVPRCTRQMRKSLRKRCQGVTHFGYKRKCFCMSLRGTPHGRSTSGLRRLGVRIASATSFVGFLRLVYQSANGRARRRY